MAGLLRSFEGGHREPVSCLAVSGDGRRVLSGSRSDADGVNLWNFETGQLLHKFPLEVNDATNAVAFSSDGQFAAAATDLQKVTLWNLTTLTQVGAVPTASTQGNGVAFPSDNAFILSANGRRYTLYDLSLKVIEEHDKLQNGRILSMSFPPTGRFVASTHVPDAADGPDVMVWDLLADNVFLKFRGGARAGHSAVAFSSSGTRLLIGDVSGRIKLINTASGTEGLGDVIRVFDPPVVSEPPPQFKGVKCIAVSSDVRFAVSGGDGPFLRLWDVSTGTEAHRFPTGDLQVNAVAFAPDSRSAISGSGTVPKVWDLSDLIR